MLLIMASISLGLGTIFTGDCRESLASLPEGSVHCCVTSPPYFGLRDYGIEPVVWGPGGNGVSGVTCQVSGNGDGPSPPVAAVLPLSRASSAKERGPGGEDGPDWRECDHVWGGHLPGLSRDDNHVADAPGARGGGKKHSAENQSQANAGQWCQRFGCGAWLGCLGSEPTPELFVAHIVEVFRAVRRVLRDDGCLWLNLGDGYAGHWGDKYAHRPFGEDRTPDASTPPHKPTPPWKDSGLKPKDLLGMPWRVAFALQADGWWLRQAVPWYKQTPMPESVTDRMTTAHEYVFLLTKQERYFWDGFAVRKGASSFADGAAHAFGPKSQNNGRGGLATQGNANSFSPGASRNLRTTDLALDVARENLAFWQEAVKALAKGGTVTDEAGEFLSITTASEGLRAAHFATYPTALVRPLILAGTSQKGCCPDCGKCWERVVERKHYGNWKQNWEGGANTGHNEQRPDRKGKDWEKYEAPEPTGWRPGCSCSPQPATRNPQPVPCTVLDPFLGAGTTALVCEQLGRRWIGCEIKQEYAEIAVRRLRAGGDQRLMAEMEGAGKVGQMEMAL